MCPTSRVKDYQAEPPTRWRSGHRLCRMACEPHGISLIEIKCPTGSSLKFRRHCCRDRGRRVLKQLQEDGHRCRSRLPLWPPERNRCRPTPIEDFSPISERPEVRRALARIRAELRETRPRLENPPSRAHAEALLPMIHRDVEPGEGPILFEAMTEFYVELLIERGWRARPWNTVAAEFRKSPRVPARCTLGWRTRPA